MPVTASEEFPLSSSTTSASAGSPLGPRGFRLVSQFGHGQRISSAGRARIVRGSKHQELHGSESAGVRCVVLISVEIPDDPSTPIRLSVQNQCLRSIQYTCAEFGLARGLEVSYESVMLLKSALGRKKQP